MPVSTTATANFSSVMSMAAEAFSRSPLADDQAQAEQYAAAAERAWDFLQANPDMIMIEGRYDNVEYGGPYTDYDETDERLWAGVSRLWADYSPEDEAELFRHLWL